MEAAAIITLISIGHWVEARVSSKASQALKSLLQLAPQTARRIQTTTGPATPARFEPRDIRNFKPQATTQTTETEVPVSELQVNDLVVLRPRAGGRSSDGWRVGRG
jgi:cation transport ATPase